MEKTSLPFACIIQIRLSLISSVLPFFVVISLINPLTEFSAGKPVREIKVSYVNAYYIAMAEKNKSLSEDGASFQFLIIN